MIVSPDYTRQNRSVMPSLVELLRTSGIRYEYNKTDGTITLEWGGVIYLASADRPESLRGANLAAVGIDEISLCSEEVYFEVLARVRDPRARRHAVIGVGTPDGGVHSWCYRRLVERPSEDRTVIFGKTSDNAALSNTDYVKNLQTRYDTRQQLTYLEGQFTDLSNSLINPSWFAYYESAPDGMAWDFALDTAYGTGGDNSALLCYGINERGNTLYIREVTTENLPFPALCRRVAAFCAANGYTERSRIFVEPKASGVSLVQQLRETTRLNVIADTPPTESKEARLLAHTAKIEAGRVVLRNNAHWLPKFLSEIGLFPKGRRDDQVDCLSMALRRFEAQTNDITLGLTSRMRRFRTLDEVINEGYLEPFRR